MRAEYWPHLFWLLIVGSWGLGFLSGMAGALGIPAEIGRAVSVPLPDRISWWQPVPYFLLSVIAIFVLSQVFFGVGSAVFVFCRGVSDYAVLSWALSIAGGIDVLNISRLQLGQLFFASLVLVANLPLSLWAAHLGAENSMKTLCRLRGRPWRDWGSRKPLSNLLMALAASVAAGLAASFALYA
jgi:hypothetical protein